MPVPEGFRAEIVGGTVCTTPQRGTRWDIIFEIACDKQDDTGHWQYQDVEFVAEVVSQGTAANDYGPKKLAYATAEDPLCLIADPYQGRCHIFTHPKDGDCTTETRVAFGQDLDLTDTVLGLTLRTDTFPRD
ncbi:Uma2 family endonuclease [Streptomyces sp. NPDC058848]|uniref:Uma2 family endonuclease n=1 Tax=unclassified Streptomyces TaxID=2593676 RepID=UPI0036BBB2F0